MFYQSQHFGISEYFHRESGKNFSFPMHMHRSFEFITVTNGCMTVNVGNTGYELKKGEGILIFPDQLHSLESDESEHLLFIFSYDIIRAFFSKHSSELPICPKFSIPEYLLSQVFDIDKDSSLIKKKGVLYALCALLEENAEYEKRRIGKNDLLGAIFDFVEKNYDKSCTLVDVSSAIGYNSSYLSRYFSAATNMSFISYVNRYRISRACYILKNTDKTVLECAYECGYTSLRSFNRNFMIFIGASPRDYRRYD